MDRPLPTLPPLTAQPLCAAVLREKYLRPHEEGIDEVFDRVARALAQAEPAEQRARWRTRFRANLQAGALVAGRIMAGAGAAVGIPGEPPATLINCFVQPLGRRWRGLDEDGWPGIEDALDEAARTLRAGGGVGYDFSALAPVAAQVASAAGHDGGWAHDVCACIDRFEQLAESAQAAGGRRGAQMAVLRIDHPDVLAFIDAKRRPGRWPHLNLSVAVSDAFMKALQADAPWALVHPARPDAARLGGTEAPGAGQTAGGGGERLALGLPPGAHGLSRPVWVYRELAAREVWLAITQAAHASAEPGLLFIDTIARDNNLRAVEDIGATNPCGEQPLPAYGGCDLGPLILPRYVRHPFGVGGAARLDLAALRRSVALQVRALDNVLDITHWPLAAQRREALAKRRIGVGFTGLADALLMLGLRYDTAAGRAMAGRLARAMRDAAYAASVALAQEKGAYALFDADDCLAPGTCASRLPTRLQQRIRRHGLRNSHLLSIAPAGSVSLAFADNASSGIEPVYDWVARRQWRRADGRLETQRVEDAAWRLYRALGGDTARLPPAFVTALHMRPDDQVAMVAAVQPYVDAGISKTVNLRADVGAEDIGRLFEQAWRSGLKGLSVYRAQAERAAVLQADA